MVSNQNDYVLTKIYEGSDALNAGQIIGVILSLLLFVGTISACVIVNKYEEREQEEAKRQSKNT